MLTSLGYSPSGEVFNVPSESLAADVAAKLQASKVIYLTEGESLIDNRSGKNIQSFRLTQAMAFLEQSGIQKNTYNFLDSEANNEMKNEETAIIQGTSSNGNTSSGFLQQLARCVHALLGGVKRAHLISPVSGGLLKELFTRDGAGILVSRDVYEGIRQAQAKDVRAVQEIITPLEEEGILVPRSRDQLEKDMQDCFLVTREDTVLACGMLKRYSETHAEVCCLAVHPRYRKEGRGETLLAYLERRALLMGITDLFVLSTRTMQWFEERGFVLSDPELLPSTRNYNKSRGSKVYTKKLGSQRDVDAEELLWNVGGNT
jgi:amino-acid N-acetyltransferase